MHSDTILNYIWNRNEKNILLKQETQVEEEGSILEYWKQGT